MQKQRGPRLSQARQDADDCLEMAMLADELVTRPTNYRDRLTVTEQRELDRFVHLSRALVRQGVIVQEALAPYLPIPMDEAA